MNDTQYLGYGYFSHTTRSYAPLVNAVIKRYTIPVSNIPARSLSLIYRRLHDSSHAIGM